MKTIRKKPATKKPETLIEEVQAIAAKHIGVIEAIITDYSFLTDIGMDTKLRAANINLKEALEALEGESFRGLIERLKTHPDFDPWEASERLSFMGEVEYIAPSSEALENYARENNYSLTKLNNSDDRAKLEQFLTTEIYPHYNDQQFFLII